MVAQVMKIGIFWPNWIGDAIMATPAVRAVRNQFPQAHLVGILKPYVAGVIEGNPWLDENIYLAARGPARERWFEVAGRLRRAKIDAAVLFPNSFRSALVAWLGRCRRRIGFARSGRRLLLTDPYSPARDRIGRLVPSPVLLSYNQLVQSLGCPDPGKRLELFTSSRDEALAARVWQEAGFHEESEVILLNPGAAFGSAKCWAPESFAALARNLVDRRGAGILVLCGPAEKDLARRIVALTDRAGVTSLVDYDLSVGLTKACIRRGDLLVSTDSGPRHMAAAFDRPVVSLFGPTHIEWTETSYAKAIHLQKKVDCGPCQRRVCPLDHRCMKLLTPQEVFAAVEELLQRYPKSLHQSADREAVKQNVLASR
jgi:heptosyltransferase-2